LPESIRINEAQIQRRLRLDRGLSVELSKVGLEVQKNARANASGRIVNIRTGDLINGITMRVDIDSEGEFVEVGSTAVHRGFAYPGHLDDTGHPWLSEALRQTVGVQRIRRIPR
jgi:hypothetical protein